MAAPIASKKALAGITFAMGIAMLVNAGPTVTTDAQRSPFDQTNVVTTPLAPVEKARAETWDLSATEWRRYRTLMDGIRGSVSPATLSPIEVLGIHARDDEERRRYAERWARLMRDDAERILAFQHAYDRAWKRLFPSDRLIDLARLPDGETADVTLQPTDRVLFFTRTDCAACDAVLRRLLKRVDTLAGVDIYLLGLPANDDKAVRDWAERQAIEPRWVRSRRVTLNHDGGALSQLTQGQGAVPYMLRRRNDVLAVLSPSVL
jgi:integrating conjugative element protein (TIGR03759 family)